MNQTKIIKLALTFIIPFIALLVLIPHFFGLQLDSESVGTLALGALLIMATINIYNRIGHQGNSPLFIGGTILLLSLMALFFSVSINTAGIQTTAIIELEARSQAYVLIGAGIGLLILVGGLKTSFANQYWWGRGGGGKR